MPEREDSERQSASATGGDNVSEVVTLYLRMRLNLETGEMDGVVQRGRFIDKRLEELDPADLLALLRECREADAPSVRLLEAYFDRLHPGWRDAQSESQEPTPPPPDSEIIPPTPIERVMWGAVDVTEEMHDTILLSLQWTGLDDEDRQIVIEGEMAMTAQRKRGFQEWLKVGEALYILQVEVIRQSNSTSNRGNPYNKAWKRLVPQQMRTLSERDRSRAIELWQARERVQPWWDGLPERHRDRWHHPATILKQFERARGIAVTTPLRDEDGEDRPRRTGEAAAKRGAAAAIDDATVRIQGTIDRLEDVAVVVTGGSPHYDLSPPMVHVAAENFRALHGGVYGDEAVQQFTQALRDSDAEWAPGSDWYNDSVDEVAAYHYKRDPERAVAVANAIRKLWQAQRRRPEGEAQPEAAPAARPRLRRGNPPAKPVLPPWCQPGDLKARAALLLQAVEDAGWKGLATPDDIYPSTLPKEASDYGSYALMELESDVVLFAGRVYLRRFAPTGAV